MDWRNDTESTTSQIRVLNEKNAILESNITNLENKLEEYKSKLEECQNKPNDCKDQSSTEGISSVIISANN